MSVSNPSLTTWVQSRLSAIYDSSLPKPDLHANFNATFSPSAQVMVNHDPTSHDTLKDNISRISGDNIEWKHINELPNDIHKPNEAGVVSGVMVVTRTHKFRIRAGPAQTQSVITFSAKVDQDPSVQADSNSDRRRIVHLFQSVVHQPAPIHFQVPGDAHHAGTSDEQAEKHADT